MFAVEGNVLWFKFSPSHIADSKTIRRFGLAGILFAAILGAGIFGIFRFADEERERELQVWQTRLTIIADTRTQAVDNWLDAQIRSVVQLSENAALQLYLTQMVSTSDSTKSSPALEAQADYLRNLLVVVSHRSGFAATARGPEVRANVRRIGVAGIALTNREGRAIVATPGMPPINGGLFDFLKSARPGETAVRDIGLDAAGEPAMVFAAPIFAVQGRGAPADQIGWAVGVKQVSKELHPLLKQPGTVWKSAEALIVQKRNNLIRYLSPTMAGDAALARSFAADTLRLASRFAIEKPGGFALRRDYRGNDVLVSGRMVAKMPWTVLYKIDRQEALGANDARLNRLVIILCLGLIGITAVLLAVWRHGASLRSARDAADSQMMAERFEAQSKFLKLITDTQPTSMFIVDERNRYKFANKIASESAGISEADLIGKSLASVLGPANALRYERLNQEVLETGVPHSELHRTGSNGDLRVWQAEHIPVPAAQNSNPGVMVVEEDISAVVKERERRERTLEQLADTLVAILDRRDPFASNHSARVAATAEALALEMALDDALVRTAKIAGRLMNIGKIVIPEELLTRAGALGDDEVRLVRGGLLKSAELLEGVEFDGPVVKVLQQVQCRWSDCDPDTRDSDEVLAVAQIVAVANAFVALISQRSWRSEIDMDKAAAQMMGDADTVFARRVLSALLNLVDNRNLRHELSISEAAAPQ
ncbi:MAG: PAS domain-containing protein [Alphaproteobacteria bacterium]|nr:PAS domain-containing protein [Alphaproteobacteria bacterium]